MATVTMDAKQGGVPQMVSGHFTSDGSAQVLTLGFTPQRVTVVNETDTIVWDKLGSMTAANCVKVTSTTQSIETSSDILINTDGTVTLSATLVGTSKAIKFTAAA